MRPSHCQLTVLDGLAPRQGEHARQCLQRAALCSRLAKLVQGNVRDKLYRLKNANICAAIRSSPGLIEVSVDNDRFFGLLSVRLIGANDVRVHTHENWIEA